MGGGSLSLSTSWHTCFNSLPRARIISVIRKGSNTLSGVAPLYASNNYSVRRLILVVIKEANHGGFKRSASVSRHHKA